MGWMGRFSLFVVCCFALPALALPTSANAAPANDAKALEASLLTLRAAALNSADSAANAGSSSIRNRRDNVADEASLLAFRVHRRVLRAIGQGYSKTQVYQRLQQLQSSLVDLDDAVLAAGTGSAIQNRYQQVLYAWQALEDSLTGPGPGPGPGPTPGPNPFWGQCSGKFGGNFFNKKTHVECSTKGIGAIAYRVEYQNQVSGQTVSGSTQGVMSPGKWQQTFKSAPVSVGKYAQYRVYLIDTTHTSHLIASGQATGNPF